MSNEDFRKPWVPQEPAYGAYGMQPAYGMQEPAHGFPAQEMPPAYAAGPQVMQEGELRERISWLEETNQRLEGTLMEMMMRSEALSRRLATLEDDVLGPLDA